MNSPMVGKGFDVTFLKLSFSRIASSHFCLSSYLQRWSLGGGKADQDVLELIVILSGGQNGNWLQRQIFDEAMRTFYLSSRWLFACPIDGVKLFLAEPDRCASDVLFKVIHRRGARNGQHRA